MLGLLLVLGLQLVIELKLEIEPELELELERKPKLGLELVQFSIFQQVEQLRSAIELERLLTFEERQQQ